MDDEGGQGPLRRDVATSTLSPHQQCSAKPETSITPDGDGNRSSVLPIYQSPASRGVPLPLPREILKHQYPTDSIIIDAIGRLRLGDAAPRTGLTPEATSGMLTGWDADRRAIDLKDARHLAGQPSPPISPTSDDTPSDAIHDPWEESQPSHTQGLSPGQTSQHGSSPMSPSISTSWRNDTFPSGFGTSGAPDILLMTPVEGPDGEPDSAFDDGYMTFALAAAPSTPMQPVFKQTPADSSASGSRDIQNRSTGELETAIETAARLIADARAAATAKFDQGSVTKSSDAMSQDDDIKGTASAMIDRLSRASQATFSSASSFVVVPPPSMSSATFNSSRPREVVSHATNDSNATRTIAGNLNDNPGPTINLDDNTDSDSGSGSERGSEEELETLFVNLAGVDDVKSPASTNVTVTRKSSNTRAARPATSVSVSVCEVEVHANIPDSTATSLDTNLNHNNHQLLAETSPETLSETASQAPQSQSITPPGRLQLHLPHNTLLTDGGCPLPTQDDYIRAILACEEDIAIAMELNRNQARFSTGLEDNDKALPDAYHAHNLGPTCSWAPTSFPKPTAGQFLKAKHIDRSGPGYRAPVAMPYIEQTGHTDSPLGMPMGTRVINFLPDFGSNSPVRCFLHTTCDGPPPPAIPLPILDSLPSFGSATTAARVVRLPSEPIPMPPPPRLSQWNAQRTETSINSAGDNADNSSSTIRYQPRPITIVEHAAYAGSYKEWSHTCIALHQIAGLVTGSQVEAAATGLANLVRHLIHNCERMGLLPQSVYDAKYAAQPEPRSRQIPPVSHFNKQVFWAKFVALGFSIFSEHALRMDLAVGTSEWARSIPEAGIVDALTVPDRSLITQPTPLTGKSYRMSGGSTATILSMTTEFWWRHGRGRNNEWDEFLRTYKKYEKEQRSKKESAADMSPDSDPDDTRLPYDEDEAKYADYEAYKDFGKDESLAMLFDMADAMHPERHRGNSSATQDQMSAKEKLLAEHRSLNLVAQFTAVRLRGGLHALANIFYGHGSDRDNATDRPDANFILNRIEFNMLLAMADDTVDAYGRLLNWQPRDGPVSHTGIRAMHQTLLKYYRHPLELYGADN